MSTISIDLEEDLVALLRQSNQPVEGSQRCSADDYKGKKGWNLTVRAVD